jgi:uncharacterized protein (DUF58 family)
VTRTALGRSVALNPSGTGGIQEAIERRLGITAAGVVVMMIVVVGWIVSRLVRSQPMTFIVYGLLILTVVSVLNARRKLPIEARRSGLPLRVREGQQVEVNLDMTAQRRVTGIIVEDELPPQLGTPSRLPVPVLPGGKEVSHTYQFVPQLRGVYPVGPLVAVTSDAFGLSRRRIRLVDEAQLIVHPRVEDVHDRVLSREWEDPPIRPPAAKPWPTGFEFYGMRDYQSGDDPRRIMWRAAARTWDPDTGMARYMVREAEQGITDRVTLVLDTDARHHSRGEPSETFETAVRAVASLGVRHLRDGFSVTAHAMGAKIADELRGSRARLPLLDSLAAVRRDEVALIQGLQRVLASPRSHTHIVIVTPQVEPDAARALKILLDRGASVMVVLISWAESDPSSARRVASLGCNFVEARTDYPLDRVFSAVHGAGTR